MRLISGQNLGHLIEGKSNQHFVYIELEVVDTLKEVTKTVQKSTVCQFNLFHPVWQDNPTFNLEIANLDTSILFIRVFSG